MPIYFRSVPVKEPFIFDSVGNHWKQERVLRPNGYPLYHYLQTEKGRGRIEIQGSSYELCEGEGVLIAPFVSHSYAQAGEDEWVTLFATITGTMESSIASMLGNRQILFTGQEQGEKLEKLICEIIKRYEETPTDGKYLSVACYGFLMNFTEGMYGNEMTEDPLYQRYVGPVIKEIETNYGEKLTVSQLSGKVYVTQQYLSRLFQRFMGCSVYEYITSFRISKAKELLLKREQAEIQSIAHQVGFGDASHFIFMFRKMTGMTPHEFRVLNQNRQ